MEEIKVGEYVRTKKGEICKVLGIRPEFKTGKRIYGHKAYYLDGRKGSLTPAFIAKHSSKLIDLIEKDDYVNGDRMDIVEKDENGHTYYMQNCELPSVNLKDIKSIVTKESFKNAEYRVETN